MAAPRLCSVEDCNKGARKRGLCDAHYNQWLRRRPDGPRCSVEGCDHPIYGHGYCSLHYQRWQRHGNPLAGRVGEGTPHLWLEACRQQDTDVCLPWPFAVTNGGYPVARIDGHNVIVTRMVCEEAHGPAPFEGADAAHSCNNRRCCNKRHLRWDTRAGNMADAIEAGTTMRGTRSPNAKLVDEDVLAIRSDQIATHEELAEQYQVSRRLIGMIKRRERWGWLD